MWLTANRTEREKKRKGKNYNNEKLREASSFILLANEEGRERVLKKHVIFPRKKRGEEGRRKHRRLGHLTWAGGEWSGVCECVHTYFAWIATYGGNEERMERNGKERKGWEWRMSIGA